MRPCKILFLDDDAASRSFAADKINGPLPKVAIPHGSDNGSFDITHDEPYGHRFPGDTIPLVFRQIAMEIVDRVEWQRAE